MKELNETQRKMYEYLAEQAQRGVMPTVREIGSHVGLKSTGSVQRYLERLEEAGYIERDPMLSRSIRVKGEKQPTVQVPLLGTVTAGMSDLFSSLADLYESDSDITEAEERKVKNLRIASATIEMLNGVVTAVAQAQQLGPIAGPIMAGINSAAVIAAGTANIRKIQQTDVSKNAGGTTSPTAPATSTIPAAVAPPTHSMEVQQVRTVTSASEEERLNQMAQEQRVYILSSDIEASQKAIRTRVQESTF